MSSSEALKPSEVLAKAADLIEPEGAWTQREYARDSNGAYTTSRDPRAVCWCALGAIIRASDGMSGSSTQFTSKIIDGRGIGAWNDDLCRTQAEVVAALRKASALAAEAGQ